MSDAGFRKWAAGWMSRYGGFWVALADRVYGPPELQYRSAGVYDAIAVHEVARRAERTVGGGGSTRSVTLHGADGSRWNLTGGGSDPLPPERRESGGWN